MTRSDRDTLCPVNPTDVHRAGLGPEHCVSCLQERVLVLTRALELFCPDVKTAKEWVALCLEPGPSAHSLEEIPEVDFSKVKPQERGKYAKRLKDKK